MKIVLRREVLAIGVLLTIGLMQAVPAMGDVRINEPNVIAGKPCLAHGPDGALYAAVEDMSLQWLYVYQSLDHGMTWGYVNGVVGGPPGFDISHPSIACGQDPGGPTWVFVAYEALYPNGTKSVEVLRLDPNNFYTAEILTVESGLPVDDEIHPEICTDYPPFLADFSVYVTYNRIGGIDRASQVAFTRSDDHGASWNPLQVLATASLSTNQRPHIAFGGPMGFPGNAYRVFVTYESAIPVGPSWRNDVYVRASHDFGNTWDPAVRLTTSTDDDYDARVASALNSLSAVVVYTSDWQNSGDLDVRYAYTTDAGVTWTTDQWLAGSTMVEKTPNVAVVYDHRFHCAYWKDWDIYYTWTGSATPTQWSTPLVVNDTHTADPVHSRPGVCALLEGPEATEGSIAWTDLRNGRYDAYFDLAPAGESAVNLPEEKLPGGSTIELGPPYPNPGTAGSAVRFSLRIDRSAVVHLEVYDVQGRRVARSGRWSLGPGSHVLPWRSAGLAPGVYCVRVVTDYGPTATTRWIAVK